MFLALDQSPTKTGFAIGAADKPPISGSHTFGTYNVRAWRDWLHQAIFFASPITAIVYELPFIPFRRPDTVTLQMLELPAIIRLAAEDHELAVIAAPISAWRHHFLGVIKGGTKFLKQQSKEACLRRGWPIANDDEADALGLLDWSLYEHYPEVQVTRRYRAAINAVE